MEKIFNIDTISLKNIEEKLPAPYKITRMSFLGGKDRATIIIFLSMDKKDLWQNNIFENSRYYKYFIDITGETYCISKGQNTNKTRKKTVKTLDQAIDYINKETKESEVLI